MLKRLNFRRICSVGLIGLSVITIKRVNDRYRDKVEEHDQFTVHTNNEHKNNIFSGMHRPFVTNDQVQLSLFKRNFPQFDFLMNKTAQEIQEKQEIKKEQPKFKLFQNSIFRGSLSYKLFNQRR